jgi:uncharacterized protein DUF4136
VAVKISHFKTSLFDKISRKWQTFGNLKHSGTILMRTNLFLLLILLLVVSCSRVHTRVSSISNNEIRAGNSIFIHPGDKSIESQKIATIIKSELQTKGFHNFTTLDNADIIVGFSGAMLGSKTNTGTVNTPVQTQVLDLNTGISSLQTTGYKSNTYSRTSHQREIRIQFYDGQKLRSKQSNPILWEAVGKSSGSSDDIILVSPQIISSMFEEFGKNANSKKHTKYF